MKVSDYVSRIKTINREINNLNDILRKMQKIEEFSFDDRGCISSTIYLLTDYNARLMNIEVEEVQKKNG